MLDAMTESVKREAVNLINSNLDYLGEVIEAAIINLPEDADLDCENEFVTELKNIYLKEADKNDLSR